LDLDAISAELRKSNSVFVEHALNVRRVFGFDALCHLIHSVLKFERVPCDGIGTVHYRFICRIDWPLDGGIADGTQERSSGHDIRS
jgi:hypothetical protein